MTTTTLPAIYAGRRNFDPAALNALHRTFWRHESARLAQSLQDPFVAEEMHDGLKRERLIPLHQQRTVYEICPPIADRQTRIREAAAEASRSSERRRFAQMGGRAKTIDALQGLIETIVMRRPTIDVEALLVALRAHAGSDVIEEIVEDEGTPRIVFVTGRTSAMPDGHMKDAPLSGLRHRLSRARKAVAERAARKNQ